MPRVWPRNRQKIPAGNSAYLHFTWRGYYSPAERDRVTLGTTTIHSLKSFLARSSGWWLTVLALCLLLLAPLLFADVPPIVDYPNHLARLFILAHAGQDPVLDSIWRPHWAIIPDLGIDLVIPPLMRITTPFVAGKAALALALLVPVAGALAYSRAAFNQRLYWPMTAGLMAYNIVFVLGFINYLISLGGALLAAALWLRLRRRSWLLRAVAGGLCAAALFFIHIFGVAFFALLVVTAELDELRHRPGGEAVGRRLVRSASLLAVTLAVPLYLWSRVPAHLSGTLIHWGAFASKLFFFAGPFIGYEALPGLPVAAAFYGLAAWWIAKRKGRVGPGIAAAALVLAGAWLALPFAIGGGTFLDSRIPVMLGLTLAAGLRPPAMEGRFGRITALSAMAALCLELIPIGVIWHRHETPVADLRRTISSIPAGSKVLVVSAPLDRDSPYWRAPPPGFLALGLFRTDYNLGALVALDRRAFWPGLFADPSQQPIAVQPPFDRLAAPGWPPEIEALTLGRSTDPSWPAPYLDNWQANFDFVLVLDAGEIPDIANYLPGKLLLRDLTPVAALLSIQR